MTLIELMVVLALTVAVFASAATLSVPWMARESMRSATHEIQSALQWTRIEAVKRNGNCRLTVDPAQRTLRVWDAVGTPGTTSDDEMLRTVQLPGAVSFARPDLGSPITFTDVGNGTYEVVFTSDGSVASGQGEVVLFGGGAYRRLTLFGAGGVQVTRWSGSQWES